MQLNPRESFTVVRQIEDHTDSSTYYVRAVIRNAKSDALLDTLNLDDKGGQRFSKSWQVPADPSGQGFYISILTSVYTDSGYTAKSVNYGDKIETLLVQERQVFNPNYPIPTGPDISYKKIEEIIERHTTKTANKIIVKIPKPQKIKIPKVDIVTPVQALLSDITKLIKGIEIPKPVNFDEVLSRIETLLKKGESRDNKEMRAILGEIKGAAEDMRKMGQTVLTSAGQDISRGLEKIIAGVENMKVNVALKMEKPEGEIVPGKEEKFPMDPRVTNLLRKK
jgi:hypothetical protein